MANEKPVRRNVKVFPDFQKTEIDTFLSPHQIIKDCNLSQNPSVQNGILSLRKYSVTIELIEESHDVLVDRLQSLWDNCVTMANAETLRNAAKALDYELKGSWGNNRR